MLKIKKIRLIPIFIFIAALTLSVKVHNVFDAVKNQTGRVITLSQSKAYAQNETEKEIQELDKVLETADSVSTEAPAGETPKKPDTFTQSEVLILQELAERREALDFRSKEIDRKAVQLKVAEAEIDKKLDQLEAYRNELKSLVQEYNEKEREKINSLIKVYSTMKPKDAARIFNTLDTDIVVSLIKDMKPSTSSAILSQMQESKAKVITDELMGNNF